MNIFLTSELEQLVNDRVSSGKYNSISEMIGEGLRLLLEQNQTMSLRAKRSGAKQSQRFSMTLHFVT